MRKRGKPKKLNSEELWNYALASLGRRAQSAAEIRRKLAVRAEKSETVTEVMAKLAEYCMADDSKFAESFASYRLQSHGLGAQRVMRDLRAKLVPERVALAAVNKAYEDTSEIDLIEAYLARKYRNTNLQEHLADPKKLSAVFRRLRTAGFRSGPSLDVLKRHAQPGAEWPDPDELTEE